jgi:hypothetical protein
MAMHTQNYKDFSLCPSSVILKNIKEHDVSENGPQSVQRLNLALSNGHNRVSVSHTPSSPEDGNISSFRNTVLHYVL